MLKNIRQAFKPKSRVSEADAPAEVHAVYRSLLGREPDAAGLEHWTHFLKRGGTREELQLAFLRSREFQTRLNARKHLPAPPPPKLQDATRTPRHDQKIAVIGNCQGRQVSRCIENMTGNPVTQRWITEEMLFGADEARADLVEIFREHHCVFIQPLLWTLVGTLEPEMKSKAVLFPSINFSAYHPDLVYIQNRQNATHLRGPADDYHSSIALLAWKAGLSVEAALNLFNVDTYRRLGMFDYWKPAEAALVEEGAAAGIDMSDYLQRWRDRGCFMHSINHPTVQALADIIRDLLKKRGIGLISEVLDENVHDPLGDSVVWPIYPELAEELGTEGSYTFRLDARHGDPQSPERSIDLRQFLQRSFAIYDGFDADELVCSRLEQSDYAALYFDLSTKARCRSIAVIGNSQALPLSRCLEAILQSKSVKVRSWVHAHVLQSSEQARDELTELFEDSGTVFLQPDIWRALQPTFSRFEKKVLLFPAVNFDAFHPDLVHVFGGSNGEIVRGPLANYHSSIALLGWQAGLDVDKTVKLYNKATYEQLGFFDYLESARKNILAQGREADLELGGCLRRWMGQGCFMHSVEHPKIFVMADIARLLAQKMGACSTDENSTMDLHDPLAESVVWPVYPELGPALGTHGSYRFKTEFWEPESGQQVPVLDLRELVTQLHEVYESLGKQPLVCKRLDQASYQTLLGQLRTEKKNRASADEARVANARPHILRGSQSIKMTVLGNCQSRSMAQCLQALSGSKMPDRHWVTNEQFSGWESGKVSLEPEFKKNDLVFMQPWIWKALSERYAHFRHKVVLYPSIGFQAYHPDLALVLKAGTMVSFEEGPGERCHSSLAFLGWQAGLSVKQTLSLFGRSTYERLSFFNYWQTSSQALIEEGHAAGLPLEDMLAQWSARGCFMHCHVHPKLWAIADIAKVLLKRLDIPLVDGDPIQYVHDFLSNGISWPVYPEIAESLSCRGDYIFKLGQHDYQPSAPVITANLEEFVSQSFAVYTKHGKDALTSWSMNRPDFQELFQEIKSEGISSVIPVASGSTKAPMNTAGLKAGAKKVVSGHPYRNLPDHQFWRKSVEGTPMENVDPVIRTGFRIDEHTRVATAGSCFAQRIAERLSAKNYNYLLTEVPPEGMAPAEASASNYGAFTARFGFLYTARQLRQLMQRAYDEFTPLDTAWPLGTDRFVDPFRPRIEPNGFASIRELEDSRQTHFAAVRKMFETLDVFVFTLGLTESWCSRHDGAAFPIAPGVAGGSMDHELYAFTNFTVEEVDRDLNDFMTRLTRINPRAKVILTVSPVPLVATYEDRHILTSTTYSKSVLRAASEQVSQRHANCDYFPSYEIITGNFNRGQYFGEDLRSVTPAGVDHVMRSFFDHYAPSQKTESLDQQRLEEARQNIRFLCDEEMLAASGND